MIVWIGLLIATFAGVYWARRSFELEDENVEISKMLEETIRERDEAWLVLSKISDQ
jgi:hypothetical protein